MRTMVAAIATNHLASSGTTPMPRAAHPALSAVILLTSDDMGGVKLHFVSVIGA
jgi:hypothetical protein